MITVLSLNTALDRTLSVREFTPHAVNLAEGSVTFAGGKGLNVARVLRRLGQEVTVVGFLGGVARQPIESACRDLGIETRWVAIAGETRTCTIVVDAASNRQTVINEVGPTVDRHEVERVRQILRETLHDGDILCIAGSAPPGVPVSFYADLVRELGPRGVRVLADVKGEALAQVLAARPWAVAPNWEEAASVLPAGDPRAAARTLAEQSAVALLTLGAEGAILATADVLCQFTPPPVATVNAVGSGDALVAGFLAGITRGMTLPDAARLGVACGASNAARREPDVGGAEEIRQLLAAVHSSE